MDTKTLVEEIKQEMASMTTACRTALSHAIRVGELLAQAKAAVGDGNWLAWVKDNLPFGHKTAQTYMRVAKNKELLSGENFAALKLSTALKLLAEPRQASAQAKDAQAVTKETPANGATSAATNDAQDDLSASNQQADDATPAVTNDAQADNATPAVTNDAQDDLSASNQPGDDAQDDAPAAVLTVKLTLKSGITPEAIRIALQGMADMEVLPQASVKAVA